MIQEINSVQDISDLLVSGVHEWEVYGDVLVRHKGDLAQFNYTSAAQYERRWNFFERVCRGLIINSKTGEIVARPFDKFFNYGERGIFPAGHMVSVTEKMDGSLGILYRDDGYKIATRGSFDSDQALWATNHLGNFDLDDLPDELTLLFEIIYPENRIVIDYGGAETLVLLAVRDRHTGEYWPFFPDVYTLAQVYGFDIPEIHRFNNAHDILDEARKIDANHEGFVVEYSDGLRLKFKGDRYVELHRLISSLTPKNIVKAMANGTIQEIVDVVPDEFLGETMDLITEIKRKVSGIQFAVETVFEKAPKDSRKAFAKYAQEHYFQGRSFAPYLFKRLDNKDYTQMIYNREDLLNG